MGRYYVNLFTRDGMVPDEEGRDFPNVDAAVAYAIDAARAIIAADAMTGHVDLHQLIRIVPPGSAAVREVSFAEAISFRDAWVPADAVAGALAL